MNEDFPSLSLLNRRHLIAKAECHQLFAGSSLDVPGKEPSAVPGARMFKTLYEQDCSHTDIAHVAEPSRQQQRKQLVAILPTSQRQIGAEDEVSKLTELQLAPLQTWRLLLEHKGF